MKRVPTDQAIKIIQGDHTVQFIYIGQIVVQAIQQVWAAQAAPCCSRWLTANKTTVGHLGINRLINN